MDRLGKYVVDPEFEAEIAVVAGHLPVFDEEDTAAQTHEMRSETLLRHQIEAGRRRRERCHEQDGVTGILGAEAAQCAMRTLTHHDRRRPVRLGDTVRDEQPPGVTCRVRHEVRDPHLRPAPLPTGTARCETILEQARAFSLWAETRQPNPECRALSQDAVDLDDPVVRCDQGRDDGQPQPAASTGAGGA